MLILINNEYYCFFVSRNPEDSLKDSMRYILTDVMILQYNSSSLVKAQSCENNCSLTHGIRCKRRGDENWCRGNDTSLLSWWSSSHAPRPDCIICFIVSLVVLALLTVLLSTLSDWISYIWCSQPGQYNFSTVLTFGS